MPTITDYRQQWRRDTAANLASDNPTLAAGEPVLETDTLKVKIGNGSTAYNSLGYFGEGNLQWSDLIGCQCTPGTDPTTDIDITAGKRRDSTDTVDLTCPAGTAAIDATFNSGTSTWGLFTGASLSAGDTAHLFAVSIDAGGVGFGFDDNISCTNLPSGCTYFRRVCSRVIGSGDVFVPGIQHGHEMVYTTHIEIFNSGTLPTSKSAISGYYAPAGGFFLVHVKAVLYQNAVASVLISGPDDDDVTPDSVNATVYVQADGNRQLSTADIWTDDGYVYHRSSDSSVSEYAVYCTGFYDNLGAFDGI